MPFSTTIIEGKGGTFMLSEPRPVININKSDIDERTDTWFADSFPNAVLAENNQHPHVPGLILDTASFEEVSPAFEAGPGQDYVPGDYRVTCHWLGDARGTTPTKFIARSATRTVGVGFDQFGEKYISWNASPMAITGTASTNLINHPGNTFSNGDAVAFPSLTGSSLVGGTVTFLPTVYYVINRTADNYQVSATKGGSAFALTTNITAGYVIDARFAAGTPHPIWPNMYVAAIASTDNYTNWRSVDVSYVGLQFAKPLHRIVTCAGVQMSSSAPIVWDFPGGWTTALNSNVQLPEVGCTDTTLTTSALATDLVPSAQAEVGPPVDAPLIRTVFIFGDDDSIVYNWPNGWSLLDESNVETLNYQISVHIKRRVWRYIWPISLK